MSRKDYIRLAVTVRTLDLSRYGKEEFQERKYIATAIATALEGTSPRFDRARFINACLFA